MGNTCGHFPADWELDSGRLTPLNCTLWLQHQNSRDVLRFPSFQTSRSFLWYKFRMIDFSSFFFKSLKGKYSVRLEMTGSLFTEHHSVQHRKLQTVSWVTAAHHLFFFFFFIDLLIFFHGVPAPPRLDQNHLMSNKMHVLQIKHGYAREKNNIDPMPGTVFQAISPRLLGALMQVVYVVRRMWKIQALRQYFFFSIGRCNWI